jgi:hypothetical protein
MSKGRTSFNLTDEANRLLTSLATRMGLTRTGAIETLIRDSAEREGLRERPTSTSAKP